LALVLETTEPVPSCTPLFIYQKAEVVFALQNLLQKTLLNQQEQEHFSNISSMKTILFFSTKLFLPYAETKLTILRPVLWDPGCLSRIPDPHQRI
jgi:hypothetical protein